MLGAQAVRRKAGGKAEKGKKGVRRTGHEARERGHEARRPAWEVEYGSGVHCSATGSATVGRVAQVNTVSSDSVALLQDKLVHCP